MKARRSATRNCIVCTLLSPLFFLLLLQGCGGEDSYQVPADSVRVTQAVQHQTALPASRIPGTDSTTTPLPDSAPAPEKSRSSADSTILAKKESRGRNDSAGTISTTTPSSEKAPEKGAEQVGTNGGKPAVEKGTGCAEITPEIVKQGRMLFIGKGNCISCHGSDAKGNALGPDLTDDTWLHISGDYPSIADVVRKGINLVIEHPTPMPPMGGAKLTDEDICAVSAYVWSLTH